MKQLGIKDNTTKTICAGVLLFCAQRPFSALGNMTVQLH
jgi:hypothetical protein